MLAALILAAAVAQLYFAVANGALPDIGKAFDSSQTTLDLIAVGYSLGRIRALPRWLRRPLRAQAVLVLGVVLSVPASVLRPSHLAAKNPQYDSERRRQVRGHTGVALAHPTGPSGPGQHGAGQVITDSVQDQLTKSSSSGGSDHRAVPAVLRRDHRRRELSFVTGANWDHKTPERSGYKRPSPREAPAITMVASS